MFRQRQRNKTQVIHYILIVIGGKGKGKTMGQICIVIVIGGLSIFCSIWDLIQSSQLPQSVCTNFLKNNCTNHAMKYVLICLNYVV